MTSYIHTYVHTFVYSLLGKFTDKGIAKLQSENGTKMLSPLLSMDGDGLPREVQNRQRHLSQQAPLLPGAPGALTATDGSVLVTLATGRGGTMQALGSVEIRRDSDLRSPVRPQESFVASRQNGRAGPTGIGIDLLEGVRPVHEVDDPCTRCPPRSLSIKGQEVKLRSCLALEAAAAADHNKTGSRRVLMDGLVCLDSTRHWRGCEEEEDICGFSLACQASMLRTGGQVPLAPDLLW